MASTELEFHKVSELPENKENYRGHVFFLDTESSGYEPGIYLCSYGVDGNLKFFSYTNSVTNGDNVGLDIDTIKGQITLWAKEVNDKMSKFAELYVRADEIAARVAKLTQDEFGNIESDIASLKIQADKITSEVTKCLNGVALCESSIKQTASDITAKINSINGSLTQLQLSVGKIETRVEDAVGNIATLEQTAEGIKSSVSSLEKNVYSTIEQTASSIRSEVSNGITSAKIIETINNGEGTVKIKADRIELDGDTITGYIDVGGITNQIENSLSKKLKAQLGIDDIEDTIDDLKKQVDGTIDNYFYDYFPVDLDESTTSGIGVTPTNVVPYSDWYIVDEATGETSDTREIHIGDTFTNLITEATKDDIRSGRSWQFTQTEDGTNADGGKKYKYTWQLMSDSASAALTEAQKTASLLDGKRQTFASTTLPTPPYDKGDLWICFDGSVEDGNATDIKVCITARKKGETAEASDWIKASNYTSKTYVDEYVSSLQKQVDGKIENYFYESFPVDKGSSTVDGKTVETILQTPSDVEPYATWKKTNDSASEADKNKVFENHINDTFTNTITEATKDDIRSGRSWRFKKDSSGAFIWELLDTESTKALKSALAAQDTADGKKTVFTDTPTTPYDRGDLWIKFDDEGKVSETKVCKQSRKSTENFEEADWTKLTEYFDSSDWTNFVDEETKKKVTEQIDTLKKAGDLIGQTDMDDALANSGYLKSDDFTSKLSDILSQDTDTNGVTAYVMQVGDKKYTWTSMTNQDANGTEYLTIGTEGDTYFTLKKDATLKASNAWILGTLITTDGYFQGNLVAKYGEIGGLIIDPTTTSVPVTDENGKIVYKSSTYGGGIYSSNYVEGKTGFRLGYDGKLIATSAEISGSLTATDGYIGGLKIEDTKSNNNGVRSDKFRTGDDGEGFKLGYDGTFEATNATLRGTIVAKSGTIGGITIKDNELISDNGKFSLTSTGVLTATGANITGAITATSLTISGDAEATLATYIKKYAPTSSGSGSGSGSVYDTMLASAFQTTLINGGAAITGNLYTANSSGFINAGISGYNDPNKSVGNNIRFFAGNSTTGHIDPTSAPFRVYDNGKLFASNATISGDITANSFTAKPDSTTTSNSVVIEVVNMNTDIAATDAAEAPEALQGQTNVPTICMNYGGTKYYLWPGAWKTNGGASVDPDKSNWLSSKVVALNGRLVNNISNFTSWIASTDGTSSLWGTTFSGTETVSNDDLETLCNNIIMYDSAIWSTINENSNIYNVISNTNCFLPNYVTNKSSSFTTYSGIKNNGNCNYIEMFTISDTGAITGNDDYDKVRDEFNDVYGTDISSRVNMTGYMDSYKNNGNAWKLNYTISDLLGHITTYGSGTLYGTTFNANVVHALSDTYLIDTVNFTISAMHIDNNGKLTTTSRITSNLKEYVLDINDLTNATYADIIGSADNTETIIISYPIYEIYMGNKYYSTTKAWNSSPTYTYFVMLKGTNIQADGDHQCDTNYSVYTAVCKSTAGYGDFATSLTQRVDMDVVISDATESKWLYNF